MKTKIRNSISGLLVIPLVLACFALLPRVQAAPDPAAIGGGNVRDGGGSLANRTTGQFNSAFGTNALFSLTTGNNNAAQGNSAQFSLVNGNKNSALGVLALRLNVHGSDNTAVGYKALEHNTSDSNTAIGSNALTNNTVGGSNTAVGFRALFNNVGDPVFFVGGNANTAIGNRALFSNTLGSGNTAIGPGALSSNTEGIDNTAIGPNALNSNIGDRNTAIGGGALGNALTGSDNIALGYLAGLNVFGASGNIHIGSEGTSTDSHVIRIGSTLAGGHTATFIAGISGRTATGGAAVFVASNGKLGTVTSSRRFKKDIADMDAASEALLALRPVTFRYKPELDNAGIPQYGLVAEEVAEVNPDLVVRDENGEIYTVRYEAVNAMLLNEFLKEHRKVQEQDATIAKLKSTVAKQEAAIVQQQNDFQVKLAHQQKQIEALSAGLRKVSAEVEMSPPAPQVVNNP
jgi:hypothetical protein